MLIAIACCFWHPAKAQLMRFYYYPKNNIYYNVTSKEYIYNHEGAWTPVSDLPAELEAGGTRIVMYSMKPDIWQMNEEHLEHYKNYTSPKGKKTRLFSFKKDEEEESRK